MPTWIALLRGINVGGHRLLPMKDLTALLEEIGCSDVKTYIQSGNVVFDNAAANAPQLAKHIGKAILDSHDFEPRVQVLTVSEFEDAVTSNPFPDAEDNPKSLHLYFLSKEPESPKLDSLDEIKTESEAWALEGKIFYFHAPDGIGRSRLAARAEALIGVAATGRNWRTVSKLLEIAKQRN